LTVSKIDPDALVKFIVSIGQRGASSIMVLSSQTILETC